jgi:hypothetical protein
VSGHTPLGGRAPGNREVSRNDLRGVRGFAACDTAYAEEEGGSWGKPGFPHGSEAKPSDERGVFA